MVTPKEIVDFSVDYICRLFEANELNGDKRGVLHEKITFGGEEALVAYFGLPLIGENAHHSKRLFSPAYWFFHDNYAFRDSFPNGGGVPGSNEHYWHLRDGLLDKSEFKDKVLGLYGTYLKTNLEIIQSSS